MNLHEDLRPRPEGIEAKHIRASLEHRLLGEPPARVGRFLLLERAGSGGMGVVYRAYDPELDRAVALKLVRGDRELGQDRLLDEARTAGRVSHPNVVVVYEVGMVDQQLFIAMEYVVGPTVREWWMAASRRAPELLATFIAAGRGLAAAHEAGVVHRDFKPDNILVGGDGRVRVSDFGLARSVAANAEIESVHNPDAGRAELEAHRSTTGNTAAQMSGTPAYMAPELVRGGRATPASDQYAFFVSLFEAFAGERPGAELRWPTKLPRVLRPIISRGLRADPGQRYPSMAAAVSALERAQPGRRVVWWIGLGLGLIAIGSAGLALTIQTSEDAAGSSCDQPLAGIWDDSARAGVERAFAAASWPGAGGLSNRLLANLDDHAAALEDQLVRECRVGSQLATSQLRRAQALCLERSRADLQTVAEILTSTKPDALNRASTVFDQLDASACDDPEQLANAELLPTDPAAATTIEAARSLLTRGGIQVELGLYDDAHESAREALSSLEAVGYEPLQADAWYLIGRSLSRGSDFQATVDALTRAELLAEIHGRDEIKGRALVAQLAIVGLQMEQPERAHRIAARAKAVHERIEAGPRLQAELLNKESAVFWHEGDLDEVIALNEEALELLESVLGPDDVALGAPLIAIANARGMQEHDDLALPLYQRAHELYVHNYGARHQATAAVLNNVGIIYREQGAYAEAVESFGLSLSITAETFGEDSFEVARVVNNLGLTHARMGEYTKALELHERALALYLATIGDDHHLVRDARDRIAAAKAELESANTE